MTVLARVWLFFVGAVALGVAIITRDVSAPPILAFECLTALICLGLSLGKA